MIIIKKKKHGVAYITVWYAEKELQEKGIIQYRSTDRPFFPHAAEFETFVSDLKKEEEVITSAFSKNCRYEIRRAPKEGVTSHFYAKDNLTDEIILEFAQYFEEFWRSKQMEHKSVEEYANEIREYAAEGQFVITCAKIGDKPIVYHTYLVDEVRVRLYQSASHFRSEDDIPYAVVGMANRYLHKEDMMYFKQQGYAEYDWGGAGKGDEVASITKFKQSFGGEPKVFYDFLVVSGMKAKILKKLTGLLERF